MATGDLDRAPGPQRPRGDALADAAPHRCRSSTEGGAAMRRRRAPARPSVQRYATPAGAAAAGATCCTPEMSQDGLRRRRRDTADDLEALPRRQRRPSHRVRQPDGSRRPGGGGRGRPRPRLWRRHRRHPLRRASVGPTGKAYGLDMTDEMLELARAQRRRGRRRERRVPQGSHRVRSRCPTPRSTSSSPTASSTSRPTRRRSSPRRTGWSAREDGWPWPMWWRAHVTDRRRSPTRRRGPPVWPGTLTESEYRSALATAGFIDVSIQHSHDLGDGSTSVIVRARTANT